MPVSQGGDRIAASVPDTLLLVAGVPVPSVVRKGRPSLCAAVRPHLPYRSQSHCITYTNPPSPTAPNWILHACQEPSGLKSRQAAETRPSRWRASGARERSGPCGWRGCR